MHPVLFTFGCLKIGSYGVLTLAAAWLAFVLMLRDEPLRRLVTLRQLVGCAVVMMTAAFLGGRVLYAAIAFGPRAAVSFQVLKSAGSIQATVVCCAAATLGFLRLQRVPFLAFADRVCAPVTAAMGLGRVGCFFAGCCAGSPTTLPWGVVFPGERTPVHPTQLYSAVALAIAFVILRRYSARPRQPGAILGVFLTLFGADRFVNEIFRREHALTLATGHTLSTFQWASIVLVAVGIALWGIATASRRGDVAALARTS